MISKFTNIFKKTDLDEKNSFRLKVIEILQAKFPDFDFTEGEDFDQISAGDLKLGLTNLRAKYLLTSQTAKDLEILVEEQFGHISETLKYVQNISGKESWESVKSFVMLQIMPTEYAEKMPLVNFPLSDEVIVGVVVDDEKTYRYVTEDDLNKWSISEDELHQEALKNLSEKTSGIEMMVMPLPVGLVIVNTMDSFDAARILLPDLRKCFADNIGTPFYFGIPNRDFLICFSAESEEEMQQNIRNQIVTDNSERPYPLSKRTFVVDGKNEIKQLDFSPVTQPDNVNLN